MEQQYQQPVAQAPPPANTAPAQAPVSTGSSFPNIVIASPTWVMILRIVQIVVSVIVLGCCAYLIHGAYADPQGFAIACSVLTWATLAYILLTEKVSSLRSAYNIFAVLSLDLFLVIMWLAAMGTNAAHRAAFTVPVEISGCVSDGSLVDSTTCWKLRKRTLVAGPAGMAVMVVVAIGCAVEFVLFAVIFGKTLAAYLQARKATAPVCPEKPPPTPQFQVAQSPVQPQTTGGTYPSPEYQQYAATYSPTPPPQQHQQHQYQAQQYQQPVYEAPGAQERHAQELPGQYAAGISPCASPPQQGYGHHPPN